MDPECSPSLSEATKSFQILGLCVLNGRQIPTCSSGLLIIQMFLNIFMRLKFWVLGRMIVQFWMREKKSSYTAYLAQEGTL